MELLLYLIQCWSYLLKRIGFKTHLLTTQVQVIINWLYSVAQFSTSKDTLPHILGAPAIDDVMSNNLLTTQAIVWILIEVARPLLG